MAGDSKKAKTSVGGGDKRGEKKKRGEVIAKRLESPIKGVVRATGSKKN